VGGNQVDRHPKRDEILQHLVTRDMTVREISENYGVTVDALNWYKRKYLKPRIKQIDEDVVNEVREENKRELRKLFFKYRDVLDALLAKAVDDIQSGRIKANTVKDIVTLIDMVTKLTGEQVVRVEMKHTWGNKVKDNPRFNPEAKGKIYTMEDLAKMR